MATPRLVAADDLFSAELRDLDCELWMGRCKFAITTPAARVRFPPASCIGWRSTSRSADSGGWASRGPADRVLVPDASFTRRKRLSAWPAKGFTEAVPDLVAEVRSPSDSWTAVVAKRGLWLAHGVRVVWLIDPGARTATTLRETGDPVMAGPDGALSAAPALPDLTILVAEPLAGLP